MAELSTEEQEADRPPRWKAWLKEIVLGVAVFGVVFFVGNEIRKSDQRGGGGVLEVASVAPDFRLLNIQNKQVVSLSDYRGKPVVLTFWGTWCGTCRTEMPDLEELHRTAEGKFHVVTVAHDPPGVLQRYLAGLDPPLSLPVLVDPPGRAGHLFKVKAVPMTVILDAEGKIVHDFTGSANLGILRDHMADLAI